MPPDTCAADRSLTLTMERANQFVFAAFPPGTPRRSIEYRKGMRSFFLLSLAGLRIKCPYAQGSVGFDAFFAGVDAARAIARRDADQ